MKNLITSLIWLFITVTATAQTTPPTNALPFHETFSGPSYKFLIDTGGNGWDITSVSPLSVDSQSKGNYLINKNGNSTRSFTTRVTVPAGINKLTFKWHELSSLTNVVIERALSYRVITVFPTNFTEITASPVPNTTWTEYTAILHADDINGQLVELEWFLTKLSGNNKYSIDEISIEGSYEFIPLTPNPVELASFTGQSLNRTATLNWTTATETNNAKFIIERSLDGEVFAKVGEVKGNGNSSTRLSYSFTDKSPAAGINYYRLRQVDTDGTEEYSNVIALEVAGGAAACVYPTVATKAVTISLQNTSGKASIQVTDITGKTVAIFSSTTLQELELPVQNFKSGMYFVRVTDGQNQQVHRFIKE